MLDGCSACGLSLGEDVCMLPKVYMICSGVRIGQVYGT